MQGQYLTSVYSIELLLHIIDCNALIRLGRGSQSSVHHPGSMCKVLHIQRDFLFCMRIFLTVKPLKFSPPK